MDVPQEPLFLLRSGFDVKLWLMLCLAWIYPAVGGGCVTSLSFASSEFAVGLVPCSVFKTTWPTSEQIAIKVSVWCHRAEAFTNSESVSAIVKTPESAHGELCSHAQKWGGEINKTTRDDAYIWTLTFSRLCAPWRKSVAFCLEW